MIIAGLLGETQWGYFVLIFWCGANSIFWFLNRSWVHQMEWQPSLLWEVRQLLVWTPAMWPFPISVHRQTQAACLIKRHILMTYMLTHVDLTTLGFCVNISVDTAICERPTVGFSKQNSPGNPHFLLKWKLWSVYWNCAISRLTYCIYCSLLELCYCCKTHFLAYIHMGGYTIFSRFCFYPFYTCTTLLKTYGFFQWPDQKVLKRGWFQVWSQQSIRPDGYGVPESKKVAWDRWKQLN